MCRIEASEAVIFRHHTTSMKGGRIESGWIRIDDCTGRASRMFEVAALSSVQILRWLRAYC